MGFSSTLLWYTNHYIYIIKKCISFNEKYKYNMVKLKSIDDKAQYQ